LSCCAAILFSKTLDGSSYQWQRKLMFI
jgi:hypothetical protein